MWLSLCVYQYSRRLRYQYVFCVTAVNLGAVNSVGAMAGVGTLIADDAAAPP